jgi:hydrogenase expression/formation protein HypC
VSCDPAAEHCITCGDEGISMRVLALDASLAVCEDQQRSTHEVAVELVAPVQVGDEILVHAGVAIRHLSAAA